MGPGGERPKGSGFGTGRWPDRGETGQGDPPGGLETFAEPDGLAAPPAGVAEVGAGEGMRVGETAPSGGLGGVQELIDEEAGD